MKRRWRGLLGSVRFRLTAGVTLLFALSLFGASWLLVSQVRSEATAAPKEQSAAEALAACPGGKVLLCAHLGNSEVGGFFVGGRLGRHHVVSFPEADGGVEPLGPAPPLAPLSETVRPDIPSRRLIALIPTSRQTSTAWAAARMASSSGSCWSPGPCRCAC